MAKTQKNTMASMCIGGGVGRLLVVIRADYPVDRDFFVAVLGNGGLARRTYSPSPHRAPLPLPLKGTVAKFCSGDSLG
jgi:hypothetical protein